MYSQILVPIDGSRTAARAFGVARKLAGEYGARIQPLYVVAATLTAYDGIWHDAFLREGTAVTEKALALMLRDGVRGQPRIMELETPRDDIPHCILRAADDFEADLVVMGTHGRTGVRRIMLGSVAEAFLRIARCPVLLISAHMDEERRRRESGRALAAW